MKNTAKILGLIAIAAVIGFAMISCQTDSDSDSWSGDTALNGTWTNTWGGSEIKFDNGSFIRSSINSEPHFQSTKGTYTTKSNTYITTKTNHYYGKYLIVALGTFGGFDTSNIIEDKWYSKSELEKLYKDLGINTDGNSDGDDIVFSIIVETTYSITGNTLTITTTEKFRQGSTDTFVNTYTKK